MEEEEEEEDGVRGQTEKDEGSVCVYETGRQPTDDTQL